MAMFFVVAYVPKLPRSDGFDEDVELRRNVYVVNVARLLTSTECVRVDPGAEIVFHEPDPVLYLRTASARYVVFHFAVIEVVWRSNLSDTIEIPHVTMGAEPRTLSDFGCGGTYTDRFPCHGFPGVPTPPPVVTLPMAYVPFHASEYACQ